MNNNFQNFSARAYLNEYYTVLGSENRLLLDFLHKTYNKIGHQKRLLEFGGGPAIYQLLSASKCIDSVTFSDYSPDCRREVIDFALSRKSSFNWGIFSNYVQKLEKEKTPIEERVRKKLEVVIPCDFRLKSPLQPGWYSDFDVLSMGSVVETSSSTEKELVAGMKNIFGLLKSKGYFVGYFSKNCKKWKNLETTYYNFPIDEQYIRGLFTKLGIKIIEINSTTNKDYNQDYQGIFCVFAQKK